MGRIIRSLSVRHLRGAKRVDIYDPRTDIVEITGANGSGKSSTLDAVEWGLRGKKALPPAPIHRGAEKGSVTVDLGDITITRNITEANASRGGTVTVRASDGSKWGQRDLDQLVDAWTFDPLAFARLRADDQVSKIRRLAGVEFCERLDALDAQIADCESGRTQAGRDVRRFGKLEAPPEVEHVDTAELAERWRAADEARQKRSLRETELAVLTREAQTWDSTVQSRLKAIEEAEAALASARSGYARAVAQRNETKARAAEIQTALDSMPALEDAEALASKLSEASKINAKAAAWDAYLAEMRRWRTAVHAHDDLQQKLEALRETRKQCLRSAELPVEGLSWTEDAIALNGIPFSGLSTVEQLSLSARIGMALSPDLRVMLIRDGGLVDDEKFEALRQLAADEGYQIWMETAGKGHSPDALVIEAGELEDSVATDSDDWRE